MATERRVRIEWTETSTHRIDLTLSDARLLIGALDGPGPKDVDSATATLNDYTAELADALSEYSGPRSVERTVGEITAVDVDPSCRWAD